MAHGSGDQSEAATALMDSPPPGPLGRRLLQALDQRRAGASALQLDGVAVAELIDGLAWDASDLWNAIDELKAVGVVNVEQGKGSVMLTWDDGAGESEADQSDVVAAKGLPEEPVPSEPGGQTQRRKPRRRKKRAKSKAGDDSASKTQGRNAAEDETVGDAIKRLGGEVEEIRRKIQALQVKVDPKERRLQVLKDIIGA